MYVVTEVYTEYSYVEEITNWVYKDLEWAKKKVKERFDSIHKLDKYNIEDVNKYKTWFYIWLPNWYSRTVRRNEVKDFI